MFNRCFILLLLFVFIGLAGCATPAQRIDKTAHRYGFERKVLQGTKFKHVAYIKAATDGSDILHVYLEGDGSPWVHSTSVARDPTPRNPLALRLMALDPAPGLYLGRPCYYGLAYSPACSPLLWTHERYSPQVISSMEMALRTELDACRCKGVVLIGYSGGGVIAALLAERIEQTKALITLAANLDIDAWAKLHDYSSLVGSLNPASRPPLDANIFQLHLAGGNDENVPANIIQAFVSRQRNAYFVMYDEFDHHCCWEKFWPDVLLKIKSRQKNHWPER